MLSKMLSRIIILSGGALYPAYRSFKTVKAKNVREYVKWMMYWIVFAVFMCLEAFIDLFFSFWFPFYYETKILFVIWLLCPYTKGASVLYRKLIHPLLMKHEREIDDYLDKAKISSYHTFAHLVARSVAHLKEFIIEAAIHGQEQFVEQMKKSSLFSEVDLDALVDEQEDAAEKITSTRMKNTSAAAGIVPLVDAPYQQQDSAQYNFPNKINKSNDENISTTTIKPSSNNQNSTALTTSDRRRITFLSDSRDYNNIRSSTSSSTNTGKSYSPSYSPQSSRLYGATNSSSAGFK